MIRLMPKVSQEYRAARREQILDAARRCFVRDGFHETSMQDLFAESGLSAGAVYGYFASKEEMVLAIALENMRDIVTMIHSFATSHRQGGIGAALGDVLEVVCAKHADNDLGAMAVQVWSEALRNPDLARRFDAQLVPMRADLASLVRTYQASGHLPPDASAESLATLFMAMIPGFILQLAMFGPQAVAGVPDAARALWPAPRSRPSTGSRRARVG
jgi:AcrR family transcriptional regulator